MSKRPRDSLPQHYTLVEGHVFRQHVDVICHQCNTTSVGEVKGIAATIFKKECPQANTYVTGSKRTLGDIHIFTADKHKPYRYIANMYAQQRKGKPTKTETTQMRKAWFQSCLRQLKLQAPLRNIKSIAFPYGIGCDLAGGNWADYSAMLDEFAKECSNLKVFVCRLPSALELTKSAKVDAKQSTLDISFSTLRREITQWLSGGKDKFETIPAKSTITPSIAWIIAQVSKLDDQRADTQLEQLLNAVNSVKDDELLNQILADFCEFPSNTGVNFTKFVSSLAQSVRSDVAGMQ